MSFLRSFIETFEKIANLGYAKPSPTGQVALPPVQTQAKQGPQGGLMAQQYQVPKEYQNQPIQGPTQPGQPILPQQSPAVGQKPRSLQETIKNHSTLFKGKIDMDKLRRKSKQDEEFDIARHKQRMQALEQKQQQMYGQIQ